MQRLNEASVKLQQPTKHDGAPQSIFAIVVLHGMLPSESATVRTLQAAIDRVAQGQLRMQTLLYDNTPGGQEVKVPAEMQYQAAPSNPGLASAYNTALQIASAEGYEWLLTLDQDTELPSEFLNILVKYVSSYGRDSRVAAIVPHIVDGGKPISPFRFVGGFLPIVLSLKLSGISKRFTSALNSASLLRVASLTEINGYDGKFPLNNSDTLLFHKLGQAGKLVAVAGELLVQHELAILNRERRMTTDRYRTLLADERAFWDLHMGVLGRMERLLRLAGRTIRDGVMGKNEAFRAITIQEIRFRLLTSRRKRIQAWAQKREGSGKIASR